MFIWIRRISTRIRNPEKHAKLKLYLRVGQTGSAGLPVLVEYQAGLEQVRARRGAWRGERARRVGRGQPVEKVHGPHGVGGRGQGKRGRLVSSPGLEKI